MGELKSVSVPVKIKFDKNFNSDKFIKLYLTFAHDGINPNKSRFKIEDLTGHKDSLFLSPLLGNVIKDEDGNYDFGSHDMEFRPNPFKNNEQQIFYLENILGIVPPEELADFKTEVIDNRNYVTVVGYLYKNYSNFAEDIIAQYENIPISMEIDVFKYSFDVKDNVYNISDFAYTGITFLSQNCGTGMIGANAKFFSQSEFQTQMLTMVQELKNTFKQFSELCNNTNNEGGNNNLENNTNSNTGATLPENQTASPTIEPVVNTTVPTQVVEPIVEPVAEPKKFTKTFELSFDDIRCGLYDLLCAVEEADNAWYYIDAVFDGYFDYVDANGIGKYYRQAYSKTDSGVTFEGERFDIFIERLTLPEKSALDMLRNNYSQEHTELEELRVFKKNYDESVTKAKQTEVFDKWNPLIENDNAEYKALKADFTAFTPEELEIKCKCIFADIKAVVPTTFSANTNKKEFTPVVVQIPNNDTNSNKTEEPYGGLFKEFN